MNVMGDLVDPSVPLEVLAEGFEFTEGPVWADGRMYFSDIPRSLRFAWDEKSGAQVVASSTNKGNGMDIDGERRLYVCEHSVSVVSRFPSPGSPARREVVASHFQGKELNSPNDTICARDGSFYFTDPVYGRVNEWVGVIRDIQLPFRGIFRVPAGAGPTEVQMLADDFGAPNGLCFSPDGSLLYVNDSPRKHIRVFDVLADGSVANNRVLIDISAEGEGTLDGMECDEFGNIWVTGPGGIWVIGPDGKKIGVVPVPIPPASLAWGGEGFDELFITAQTTLYRVRTRVHGAKTFE